MKTMKVEGIMNIYKEVQMSGLEIRMSYECRKNTCHECNYKKECDRFYAMPYNTTPNGYVLPDHYKPTNNWLKYHGLPLIRNKYIERSK